MFEARGARLGARPEAPDFATALTFGDVPAEYAAAREGACLFDQTDRGRLRVSGSEAASFLHRILANEVRALADDQVSSNLLLTPKGKVRAMFELTRKGDTFEASTPPGAAAEFAAAIDEFLFTEDVTVADTSDAHAPVELFGPRADAVVAAFAGREFDSVTHTEVSVEVSGMRVRIAPATVAGRAGWRLDAGPTHAVALWDALCAAGATPAGIVVRDILRVENGAALFGVDVDDNVYPQEARLDASFSLDKGCYVGQEVVAKIDTYGGLNKQMFALRIDHDDPLARGTKLFVDDDGEAREVGIITSWAYSFALDTGVALGYVKRRHQALGTRFTLGDAPGTAERVDFPG